MKSKEVKTGCILAESSKEGYGPKSVVLSMMVMIDKELIMELIPLVC
jgi:hypothetical protein